MSENTAFDSPVGELEWAFIDGEGKKDLQGKPKYSIDVVITAEQEKAFRPIVDQYWADNKPTGAKTPKSCGIYEHSVKDEEASKEAGSNVYVSDGNFVLRFKTGISYQSGDAKVVKIFNSKGNEVSLMGKKIGNGSRGRVGGVMAIYTQGGQPGVTFYLNSVQLTKLVEYTGGDSFSELEDEDGEGFDGVDGAQAAVEDLPDVADKPRL